MDLSFNVNHLSHEFYQTYTLLNHSEREIYDLLVHEFKKTRRPLLVDFKLIFEKIYRNGLSHDIHTYPGKLYPHLAKFFCKALYQEESANKFLDPFVGSGTTIVEAIVEGYEASYCDINPLARLLTKVKTTPLEKELIIYYLEKLIFEYQNIQVFETIDVINASHWYDNRVKNNLDKLMGCINRLDHADVRDFFKIAFSHLARKVSYCDLQVSVPVKIKVKSNFSELRKAEIQKRLAYIENANVVEIFKEIVEKYSNSLGDFSNNLKKYSSNPSLLSNNVALVQEDGTFDLIMTSPPYGSAQKYIRASSLSLNWLNLSTPQEVTNLVNTSIGKERVSKADKEKSDEYFEKLHNKFKITLEKVKEIDLNRYYITLTYLKEMDDVLDNIVKALKENGKLVLIIGNNTVCNQVFYNDEFLINLMENKGLTLEIHLIDFIKSRGLMIKRNKTSGIINYESILIFRKNGQH
ncbi:SAM-dependent methyltransferase [Acinetobacter baumannii]